VKFGCVIPARYGSTRLPGKPLADIAGKPMIERVYDRVSQATKTACTIVATDDDRVYSAVQQFGGTVMMTDPNHPTGTDRLAEVASHYTDLDVVINVQGDEPMIEPNLIDDLAHLFEEDPNLQMANVATPFFEGGKEKKKNPTQPFDRPSYPPAVPRRFLPRHPNRCDGSFR